MSPITSKFGYRSDALEVVESVDLSGRTALVTGASSGIGLETARALAAAGAHVAVAVRDLGRGEAALAEIARTHPNARLELGRLDLSDLATIREFAARFTAEHEQLHIMVNNAAVMATPFERTTQGFELQFGSNHLGHFALFLGVLAPLRAARGARVVALSSIAHRISDVDFDDPNYERREYEKWQAYGQSKTACSLFAVGVTQRHGNEGILANAVHPGGIMTGLQKHMPIEEQRAMGWIDDEGNVNDRFKTVTQGASTSTWAAVGAELDGVGGLYLEDCGEAAEWRADFPFAGRRPYAIDPAGAQRLWDLSTALIDDV
jgi:NAD(P)-dependent dehydrogenase (short-subunit alcohol dehydrogenase family)